MDDPTCVFRCDAELVQALEATLGPPIDSYLMGWQVWLEPVEIAGREVELEFRLHPPGGFQQPEELSHHDLWDEVAQQLADGRGELELGDERRTLDEVWVLLEVYPAYGEPVTAQELREAAEEVVGRPATAAGRVDHARLGSRWKRHRSDDGTGGDFDLPGALLEALGADPEERPPAGRP